MLTEQEKTAVRKETLKHVGLCKQLFNVEVEPDVPAPPELACVYAFEMSNDTVKIGVTKNVDRRKKGVNNFLTIKRIHHTDFAPSYFMMKLERKCHAAFADRRAHGEYFNITFEEAVAELDKYAGEIADAFNAVDKKYLEEVIYFYEEFLPQYNAKKVKPLSDKVPQVVEVEGVLGYVDKDNIVHLKADDVAHWLGFMHVEGKISQGNIYPVIHWDTINGYLAEFDFPTVKPGDFIPENAFYLLAMKANNAAAKTFQLKVANKILPAIRQHGFYSEKPLESPAIAAVDFTALVERMDNLELLVQTLIDSLAQAKDTSEKELSKADRADKLLQVADRLPDSSDRQKLLLHAANLINGKKIF